MTLRLNVSKCSGHRQAAWENAQRTLHVKVFLIRICSRLGEGLGTVDLASCCLDSDTFLLVIRFMIACQNCDLSSSVERHQAARVTNIDHVSHFVNDHDHSSAGARALRTDLLAWHSILSACLGDLDQVDEASFALFKACNDGLMWKLREILVLNDEVMKIVAKVVSAGSTSMPVENAKEAYLRPLNGQVLLAFRFQDVEDNRYSVLIIVSYNALICIGCVAFNHSALLL